MRYFRLLFLSLFLSAFSYGQENFAEQCLGNWEGILYIYQEGQLKDSVPVSLEVKPTEFQDTFKWKTTYHSEQFPVVKDYQLRMVNTEEQAYIMDEGDGIELHMYRFDNKLFSLFETENIMLNSVYELRGDSLYFEVGSGKQLPSGDRVTSYDLRFFQKVLYTRSETEEEN